MEKLNVLRFGLSVDTVEIQKSFHEEQKLDFPLLADADGVVAQLYKVLREDGKFASRVTVVVDEKDVIRAIVDDVNVAQHGGDLVKLILDLRMDCDRGKE